MRRWAIIWICILGFFSRQSLAIQAACNSYVFFQKNIKDSTQYAANILLSWRAQNNSLHYLKNDKGEYYAEINCLMRISSDTAIIKEQILSIKSPAKKNLSDCRDLLIADQYSIPVAIAGDYEVECVLFEQNYKNELFEFHKNVNIPSPQNSSITLSDIMILDTSFLSNTPTPFSHMGWINIPNCGNFIDEHKSNIDFNFEIYPTTTKLQKSDRIEILNFISFKENENPIPGKTQIDTLIFSNQQTLKQFRKHIATNDLKSGNYYLNVVCSKEGIELCKKTAFFQLYNPNYVAPKVDIKQKDSTKKDSEFSQILDLTSTFVGKYNPAQIRAILKMLLLICDESEASSINGFLHKPDELYSKYFIYNFWEKRDKQNPDKAWKAFAERIQEVNRMFKGSGRSGFETDRGRVYIQYGKPNDRIIVNNESGALPYEIWQYYNTGKQGMEGVFLFYKPGRALGDYQLLHCTLIGEKRNTNWRALLYNNSITGAGAANSDSQAEQYIGRK